MKANIYTGAVQFINIYNYHDVKTKRLFFCWSNARPQYHKDTYMIMEWTVQVNNTVAYDTNIKVDKFRYYEVPQTKTQM